MTGLSNDLWDATLQAGGLEVLDVDLMYRITSFYSMLGVAGENINRINRLIDHVLIPNLDAEPREFYDLKKQRLRKKYRWYYAHLKRIRSVLPQLETQAADLATRLESFCTELHQPAS